MPHRETHVTVTALPVAPVTNGNSAIENWLDGHGLPYAHKTLKLENIDKNASLRNQARVGAPLNDDQVLMYAAAMENGDQFPPLVVYQQTEAKKYIVIDGNHRMAAHELVGHESVDTYVVEKPSSAQVVTLTFEANTKHGLPTSMDERLRQAVLLVERGATQKSAAQRLGVPERRVQDAVYVRRGDRRAETMGLSRRWYDLSQSTRRLLAGLHNDNTFKEAATLAMDVKMSSPEAQRFVKDLNDTRTEQAALALIGKRAEERKEEIKVTAGGRLGLTPRLAQYNAAVRKVTHIQVSDIKKIDMGQDLKARLRLNTIQAMNRMSEILEVLK